MSDLTWVPVVPADDLAGPPWPCHEVEGTRVRLLRDPQGRIHAVEPSCPHLDSPLDRAEVEGDHLLCPRHWYAYDLTTGQNQHPGLEHSDTLVVHHVRVRDGMIHVALSEPS